jgi:hypothetical protein
MKTSHSQPIRRIWLAMLGLAMIANCAHAWDLISAKYRHDGDSTYVGPAILGSGVPGVSGDIWNDVCDAGFAGQAHSYSPVVDTTGATVPGIAIETLDNYNGGNFWGSGDYWAGGTFLMNSSSPYYNLFRTYFGANEPRIQITGLTPNAKYDLVIYLHQHDNRAMQIWANGIQKRTYYNNEISGGSAPLVGRDAVVFSDLAADGAGKILFYRDNYNEGVYCGFQLRPHLTPPVPTGANGSVTIAKNAFKTFATGDFGFSSTDPLASFAQVQITSLPTNGQLLLSGSPVLLNQIISAANISAGSLVYQPTTNYTGTDSFQFKVSDGVNFSAAANTYTVTVVPQASLIDIQFYRVASGDTAFGPGAAVIGAAGNQWIPRR